MSEPNGYSHVRNREHAVELLHKSQKRVAQLEEQNYELKETVGNLNRRLSSCQTKADHFDILIKAVKENALVRATWDKFMMTLRMAGYDGTQ